MNMKLLDEIHPRTIEYQIFQKSSLTTTGVQVGDFGYSGCVEWMGFGESAVYPYAVRDKAQDEIEKVLYQHQNRMKWRILDSAKGELNG